MPRNAIEGHEASGSGPFRINGYGHATPRVPALAYPICTRNSETEAVSPVAF